MLNYRSFASVVPLIGMVMTVIVAATGLAAVAFLLAEGRVMPAIIAVILSGAFSVLIAMLIPPRHVTLFHGNTPALNVVQESNVSFPMVTYAVMTPERQIVARIRRTAASRLARDRWKIIWANGMGTIGYAVEESLQRAWMRRIAGKFNPKYQSNIRIRYEGKDAAWIVRRPNRDGERDMLEINGAIDRRVAVALATLVFGSEP